MGTNRVERSAFENGGMDKSEHDHDHHDHYLPDHHTDPLHVVSPDDREHTTFVKYYRGFLEETLKAFKPRYFSITRIVFSFAFVLIYSLTWCQLSLTEGYIITRKIALYLLQVHTGFDCGLETAASTRMFMMETSKGGPKVSHSLPARVAHLLARMTSETVLMLGHFVPQCFVLYWIIGLSPYAGAFFVTMFILLANCICSQSVGRLIGTLSPLSVGDTGHVANATMIMITVYAGFVMFSKPYLQYLNYASFQFYSLMGSYQSEFELGGTVQSFRCAAPNATMFGSCKHEESDGSVDAYDSVSPLIPIPPLYGNCLILLFFPLVANLLTLAAYSFITQPKTYTAHHGVHDEHEHDSRA